MQFLGLMHIGLKNATFMGTDITSMFERGAFGQKEKVLNALKHA